MGNKEKESIKKFRNGNTLELIPEERGWLMMTTEENIKKYQKCALCKKELEGEKKYWCEKFDRIFCKVCDHNYDLCRLRLVKKGKHEHDHIIGICLIEDDKE